MVECRQIAPKEGLELLKRLQVNGGSDSSDLFFCRPVWKEMADGFSSAMQRVSGDILVIYENEAVEKIIEDRLGSDDFGQARFIFAKTGTRFEAKGPDRFTIRPDHPDDYNRLIQALNKDSGPPRTILHLLSNDPYTGQENNLKAQIGASLYSLFFLTRALLALKPTDRIQIIYFYQEPSGRSQPQYAGCSGFARSLGLESRTVAIKTVSIPDIQKIAVLSIPRILAMEDVEIRFRGDRYLVRAIEESIPDDASDPIGPLKENGVYLLTGGAGGLGFVFAEHLAKQVKAKLILTGRSPLGDEKALKIEALRGLGSEVIYIQADVSRQEAAHALIAQARSRFNRINGVIHCAGIVRDNLIINKPVDDLSAVMAPKVFGTLHMDAATKDEPLDFFVLFSSVSAVTGNMGQADYAYANSFMDHFVSVREQSRRESRRTGKTISINWPLWREGGMRVDAQTEIFLAQTAGMKPLNRMSGLNAFSLCLASSHNRWMVAAGNRGQIRRALIGKPDHAGLNRPDAGVRKTDFLSALGKDVLSIASDILKIDVQDIDWNEDIGEYGFDSISFTEFANRINRQFRLDITPAVFFELPSIGAFTEFLAGNYMDHLSDYYRADSTVKTAPKPELQVPEAAENPEPLIADRFKTPPVEPVHAEAEDRSIAVIGMSGVMPGSEDPEAFWKHLVAGDDLITEVPKDRWDWRRFELDSTIETDQIKWGGFMSDVDKFDCLFFGISPREAELMDPQQRLFMQTVWKTIEDAGYAPSSLSGTRTGLFVGVATSDYVELVRDRAAEIEAHASTGMSHCILANRISYLLDIHGPSEPIDTACSSSLVAIHRAVEAIRSGSCDAAIAGGVNVILAPSLTIAFGKAGMLSPDGRCKTFDARADGYVRGEGAGAVLLKPLSRAVADGDHIYAVIRGTAENHGGRAKSLTAPNPNAQAELLVDAYENAGVAPDSVTYIEAHGTGTRLGDPIEINGLKKAFKVLCEKQGKTLPSEPVCGIGSVKSNIGHLETAAGISSVIKVLLALKHRKLPASIHFREQNPYIDLVGSPFYIVSETREWEPLKDAAGGRLPRRAGVSSFGYGGSNAHVVLEEYQEPEVRGERSGGRGEPQLIVLSAKNEERLKAYAEKMVAYIDRLLEKETVSDRKPARQNYNISLADFAYTLQAGRDALESRLAVTVTTFETLRDRLKKWITDGGESDEIFLGNIEYFKGKAKPLVEGRAGEEFIRIVIEDRQLEKIGQLWITGVDIDWKLLHPSSPPARISLPTYPFARERHWIPDREDGGIPGRRKTPTGSRRAQASEQEPFEIEEMPRTAPEKPEQSIEIDRAAGSRQLFPMALAFLTDLMGDLLKLSTEKIDPHVNIEAYGVDSVLVNRFNVRMEEIFGPMPRTLLFEYQTLFDLAAYLAENYSEAVSHMIETGTPQSDQEPSDSRPVGKSFQVVESIEAGQLKRETASGTDFRKERKADQGPEEEIAIIGIDGRFPFAGNLREFWENLKTGRDCITEIPPGRWDFSNRFDPDPDAVKDGKIYCRWGGFLDDVDRFDALFFKISPREAEMMDPQERLFLETTWRTLESAGYTRQRLDGGRIGVFVGVTTQTYMLWGPEVWQGGNIGLPLSLPWSIANRISYFFNFMGPSIPVDTACSSSLTAVHLACDSIRKGECDMALAGGVNLYLHPIKYYQLCLSRMLSPSGRCRSFGEGADGFVPGEGVGAILLKPLHQAVKDGDPVLAVVKGNAVNHGGRTTGYTVPNPKSQAALIRDVLVKSGIHPDTLSFVEAHGTGTALGDPVEIRGLTEAYAEYTQARQYCAVGSVKSNIGHLESAAGIAGIAKIVLQMKHGMLAPSLHADKLNANIRFEETPFYVQREPAEWKRLKITVKGNVTEYPRRAAISSFGAGGANAHMILEEYEEPEVRGEGSEVRGEQQLIVLSAKNEDRLRAYAASVVKSLEIENRDSKIENIAYTLQIGREAMEERLAAVVSSPAELAQVISDYLRNDSGIENLYLGNVHASGSKGRIDTQVEGVTGKAIPEKIIANRDYHKIAPLWVAGVDMDWARLWTGTAPRRIVLPTYPFAGNRHWIPDILSPDSIPAAGKPPDAGRRRNRLETVATPELMLFRNMDAETAVEHPGAVPFTDGPVLLFDSDDRRQAVLRHKLGADVILVRPGAQFNASTPSSFVIDPGNPDDYGKLISSLKDQNRLPKGMIHLWSQGVFSEDEDDLKRQLEMGLYSLFYLSRAFLAEKPEILSQILYLYPEPTGYRQPHYAAVGGFAKTLLTESTKLVCKTISFSAVDDVPDIIATEFHTADSVEIRYRDGQRRIRRLVEADPRPIDTGALPLKEKGIYLLTGGAGGLGLIFAEFLAERVKAGLVLTGRSSLTDVRSEKIEALRERGAEVVYLEADISSKADVTELMRQIKSRYGKLDGIIHGAGVIQDAFILKKTVKQMERVLAPKVQGTFYLDHVTRREPLDFFVLFSSMAAVTGNAGQSDYAYANSFLDRFSEWRESMRRKDRRSGVTVSFNWPLWRDGGMHVDAETEKMLAATLGMTPLDRASGMDSFLMGLMSNQSQLAIIKGNREQVLQKFTGKTESTEAPVSSQAGDSCSLLDRLRNDLLEMASSISKFDAESIHLDVELSEYGFASISLTELANLINDRYRIEIGSPLFFEYPTIDAVSSHLLERYPDAVADCCRNLTDPGSISRFVGHPSADAAAAPVGKSIGGDRDRKRDASESGYEPEPTEDKPMPFQRTAEEQGPVSPALIVPIHSGRMRNRTPFFCVPGVGGNGHYYYQLARWLGADQPFYTFLSAGLDGRTKPHTRIDEMAASYVKEIEKIQKQGPYLLGGHSLGGRIAYAMAVQLLNSGRPVAILAVFDEVAPVPVFKEQDHIHDDAYLICEAAAATEAFNGIDLKISYDDLKALDWEDKIRYMKKRYQTADMFPQGGTMEQFRGMMEIYKVQRRMTYTPQPAANPFKIILFRSENSNRDEYESPDIQKDKTWGWCRFAAEPVEVVETGGTHNTIMADPHVQEIADHLAAAVAHSTGNINSEKDGMKSNGKES